MLNKFSDNYFENYNKLSFEKQQEMTNNFFVMFYGGEKELISRFTELKQQSKYEEGILKILKIETNLDFFSKVLERIQFNNITEVIKTTSKMHEDTDGLCNLITDHEGFKKMVEIYKPLAIYHLKTLFDIDLESKTREESKELTKKIVYMTKESIAKEFESNKRTLTKWLEIHFDDRFVRKDRKITINEYIEIFEAFFLKAEENLDLNRDQDKYFKRLEKGVNFSKSDLALLCDSDLKTLKDNLKKIPFYASVNKFPYSTSEKLINRMGVELGF
ncbi:hypothetical protein [Flavobacterium salmonis]|uniref:Uncharacterized protein n=1 Tax=Flavobacterium salmonis TaxID=2654844 RepID=A0A6V6YSF5_9FLAO|nr:hypothetical protein [Flavobacterium salmonis]CAD0002373.1 hypothetical protein FLAT13_01090 [Flavobacterium salmonis]